MLDMEGIVRDWINSRDDLVGEGRPLTRGAYLKRLRSQGAYAFLISVGTPGDLSAEVPIARARVSATIYGRTKEVSSNAATAYMTVLESVNGKPETVGAYRILVVDNITGPLPLDDQLTTREEFRYLVDADFYVSL